MRMLLVKGGVDQDVFWKKNSHPAYIFLKIVSSIIRRLSIYFSKSQYLLSQFFISIKIN
jgi:hypothetical protein